jgi:hypothetical protein
VGLDAPVPEQIASEEELLAEALDGAVDE